MKVKDLAARYGVNPISFESFLKTSQYKPLLKSGITGTTIDDNANFDEIINAFRNHLAQINEREAQEKQAALDKQAAMASMLITSGFNFDGYRVVKYSGYISGDDAVEVPRTGFFDRGANGEKLTDALVKIRRQALFELKEAAYSLGCNAVIGVDFDYITLEPETQGTFDKSTTYLEPYVICVTANGNAVVIEKNEDFNDVN